MTKNKFDLEAHNNLTAAVIAEFLSHEINNDGDCSIDLDAWFEDVKPILKRELVYRYADDLEIVEE